MKKRVLFNSYTNQFVFIPTFGIMKNRDYACRIGFLWGPFALSVGVFRKKGEIPHD